MIEMPFLWGLAALVGAAVGSFITLVTHRLPLGEAIGMTRSRCPKCKHVLGLCDLMPVLSWLFARGRCRHCHARISMRYPLTELACALGAVGALLLAGFTLEALALAGLWWCVVAIFVTDLEHYIILDEVQIALIGFGLLYHDALGNALLPVLASGVAGLLIGLALKYGFLYLRQKDGLGLGDVKLLFGVGIWLGSSIALVPFLFFAGVLGVVCGLLWRALGHGAQFPFGPALAMALVMGVVWPEATQYFWQTYGVQN